MDDVTMELYACTDVECIRAGHPNHPGSVTTWPDGAVEVKPYGGDGQDQQRISST